MDLRQPCCPVRTPNTREKEAEKMHKAHIRKVGGSQMVAIPKPFLDRFRIGAGDQVEIDEDGKHIVIRPLKSEPTLADLIAQCDLSVPLEMTDEDREFLEAKPVGAELYD